MNVEINEVQSAPFNLLLPLVLAPRKSPLPTLAEIQVHALRALGEKLFISSHNSSDL